MGDVSADAGIEHAASSDVWLRRTLAEILQQLRVLLEIDGCAFQTIDWDSRAIAPAAMWFETPAIRATLQPVLQRRYDPARGGVTEAAVERGAPLVLANIDGWEGAERLRARLREQLDPRAAEDAWTWYRTSSFISCPVRTAGGRTLGVLAMCASPPRPPLGEEHLRVTEVFASLAAIALERAELLEAEERRAEAEELLNAAAQRVTASLELATVYEAIVEQAAIVTAAPAVELLRYEPASGTLRAVAAHGAPIVRRGPDDAALAAAVVASGEPVASPVDGAPGGACLLHVALGLGPRCFGVLTISQPDADTLDERRRALLASFVRPAAAAIANALEFQHEHRIAAALTRGYLPSAPPEVDGYELGVVFEPVGNEVCGGDVFGVWRLPGGALAVLVGDVSGKGIEVAAVGAMVRYVIEARTWDAICPAVVLTQANAILRRRLPGRVSLVTAFLAIVDGGVMRYANAGHVPPLVVDRDGGLRELPTTGVPLGIQEQIAFTSRELAFGPQQLLFASTDGLVEARRDGEQFGHERVGALVADHASQLGPQQLVALAHARALAWAGAPLSDDVAIIALRPC